MTVAGGYDEDFQRGDAATGDVTVVVNGATDASIGGTDTLGLDGTGGGGAGGVRAIVAGTGGRPGGASIGILVASTNPTVIDVSIELGTGGAAGAGGAGAVPGWAGNDGLRIEVASL